MTALTNATPMRSEEGELESVVETIQDMTPLEELEKLRAPLTSIKGSAGILLESFNSLDSAEMVQFIRIIKS